MGLSLSELYEELENDLGTVKALLICVPLALLIGLVWIVCIGTMVHFLGWASTLCVGAFCQLIKH